MFNLLCIQYQHISFLITFIFSSISESIGHLFQKLTMHGQILLFLQLKFLNF